MDREAFLDIEGESVPEPTMVNVALIPDEDFSWDAVDDGIAWSQNSKFCEAIWDMNSLEELVALENKIEIEDRLFFGSAFRQQACWLKRQEIKRKEDEGRERFVREREAALREEANHLHEKTLEFQEQRRVALAEERMQHDTRKEAIVVKVAERKLPMDIVMKLGTCMKRVPTHDIGMYTTHGWTIVQRG